MCLKTAGGMYLRLVALLWHGASRRLSLESAKITATDHDSVQYWNHLDYTCSKRNSQLWRLTALLMSITRSTAAHTTVTNVVTRNTRSRLCTPRSDLYLHATCCAPPPTTQTTTSNVGAASKLDRTDSKKVRFPFSSGITVGFYCSHWRPRKSPYVTFNCILVEAKEPITNTPFIRQIYPIS